MDKRISESELILPTLLVLVKNEGIVSTSNLIKNLRQILKPEGKDAQIINGRNDDYFSQKVRNLKSHNTLERFGLAIYRDRHFIITENGTKYFNENKDIIYYLLTNDFNYTDINNCLIDVERHRDKKIEIFDENIIINEGIKTIYTTTIYRRSKELRDFAIQHYTQKDHIPCICCNFDFEKIYGDLGKGFIEMHHIKPIFKYEDEDLEKTMIKAIKNIVPVCSNCHRIIHRNKKKPIDIDYLAKIIKENQQQSA